MHQVTSWSIQPFGHNRDVPKIGWALCPFSGEGELGPNRTQCRLVEAYLHTKWHRDPSSHLGIINMGRKLRALSLFGGGGARSAFNTMSLALRPTFLPSEILIHPAIWPQDIWAENWRRGYTPWGRGTKVPIYHNVARAEAYLHTKFHLDPTNRLARIYQCCRQDETDWTGKRPKP